MKTLHFPKNSGLNPRPFDAYDAVCERYYRSFGNNGSAALRTRRECESELRSRFSSDDLDMDFTHGRNIATRYTVTND